MKGKKLLIVILAMMMVFTFTACGGGGGGGADEEVIFNIATTNGEDSLSFFNAESAKVEDWMHLMYDSLLEFDENYNAVPHVATSFHQGFQRAHQGRYGPDDPRCHHGLL